MLDLGTLIGGAITVEMIFGYPGMGKLLFDSIQSNDFTVVMPTGVIGKAWKLLGTLLKRFITLPIDAVRSPIGLTNLLKLSDKF